MASPATAINEADLEKFPVCKIAVSVQLQPPDNLCIVVQFSDMPYAGLYATFLQRARPPFEYTATPGTDDTVTLTLPNLGSPFPLMIDSKGECLFESENVAKTWEEQTGLWRRTPGQGRMSRACADYMFARDLMKALRLDMGDMRDAWEGTPTAKPRRGIWEYMYARHQRKVLEKGVKTRGR
ncbi:hypothetical protein N656DRAFT_785365 [Canariomyces notabilis]|uniref:Uncharacterized protein n=1 Tax=Canariomyces notabilis TaxID=2074819 RepID=A0AAN6T829_9PEZI|nr:hypothetical protein N656DRAFT_785365 [Canariomyces arenarius]